jgi:hypothetical protein
VNTTILAAYIVSKTYLIFSAPKHELPHRNGVVLLPDLLNSKAIFEMVQSLCQRIKLRGQKVDVKVDVRYQAIRNQNCTGILFLHKIQQSITYGTLLNFTGALSEYEYVFLAAR